MGVFPFHYFLIFFKVKPRVVFFLSGPPFEVLSFVFDEVDDDAAG